MAELDKLVPVYLPHSVWLLLLGWMHAHRPPGDWEPEFVTVGVTEIYKQVPHG